MKIENTSAADLVYECRQAAGHPTVYAAAKDAGLSSGTLHRIEHGDQDPSVGCLRAVLGKLGYRLSLVATRKQPK